MTLKIKSKYVEPVKKKDGTWDVQVVEVEEEFSEEQMRHNLFCTKCGFPTYPECREWCRQEGGTLKRVVIDEDKIKGKLVLSHEEFQDAIIKME